MPSAGVIIAVIVCCVVVIVSTVLGVYFSNVACPSFGADCSTTAAGAAPAPVTAPAPVAPTPVPTPPAGTPSAVAAAPLATPPPPAADSTYRLTPDTIAYRGDSGRAAKTIKTVSGDVNTCKSSCDATSDCTHFERMGNSCTLYRGAEWVGSQPGGESYCKAQCQGA